MRALSVWVLLTSFLGQAVAQDTIVSGLLQRTYTVRTPSTYDGITPLPLVIAMHGGFGSGTQLEEQSGLTAKAEDEGFIVVYPDGYPSPIGIRTWNAGGCCGFAMNTGIDDVGFIATLLDTLTNAYAIDTLRIYATGMSNGGFMSYRLACELSERVAAIAPVSASMTIAVCEPARSVPVIGMHSYLDTSVPYLGGVGDGVSDHYNSPQDSVQTAFALHANCAVLRDTIQDDAEMTVVRWHACNCQQEMLLYMTHDGGHSWPGGVGTGIGDPPSTVLDANDRMWDFFQQYTLDCNMPQGFAATFVPARIHLRPNPADEVITVSGTGIVSVTVTDLSGRRILSRDITATNTLDLSCRDWASGTYVVRVMQDTGFSSTQRCVVH